MSYIFEDLQKGLQEAIEFEKGKEKVGMTQAVFASYMEVSKNSRSMGKRKKPPYSTGMQAIKHTRFKKRKELIFC